MKIIKRGELAQEKVYRDTCRECGTIFEYQAKEAKYNQDDRDGDYLSINCPLCGHLSTRQARS